ASIFRFISFLTIDYMLQDPAVVCSSSWDLLFVLTGLLLFESPWYHPIWLMVWQKRHRLHFVQSKSSLALGQVCYIKQQAVHFPLPCFVNRYSDRNHKVSCYSSVSG